MRYRHTKSGVIIDVNSKMGGCWEPVEEPGTPPVAPAKPEDKPSKPKKKKA